MELKAKKSLGQHFLKSPSALKAIISAADIQKGETVLEIGPGTGILTQELLNTGAKVVAVEKDGRSIDILKETFTENIGKGELNIIEGDILETELKKILPEKYSVVANIPYYITGAILALFLESNFQPEKIVLLVQKEVADRIVSRDGKESVLSVSVKAFGEPKIIAKVPRGAFVPAPEVDSAILKISAIQNTFFIENNVDIKGFFRILKSGFAHKRKFAQSNISDVLGHEKTEIVWKNLSLPEKIRPEEIPAETWKKIAFLSTEIDKKAR